MNNVGTTHEVDLPSIPTDLIVPIEKLNELNPVVLYHQDGGIYHTDWYHVYICNQELTDWVIEHFPVEIELVEYVVSDRAINMHTDLGRD